MAEEPSLRQFLDSSDYPTLILDSRLRSRIGDDSQVTIGDLRVHHNAACEAENFISAFNGLLLQKPENELNLMQNGDQFGSRSRFKLGPYEIWTLQPENKNYGHDASTAASPSLRDEGNGVYIPSRESQLYSRLDNMQGPLRSFSDLSAQSLKDIEAAKNALSSASEDTENNTAKSQKLSVYLDQTELTLRTLSSGLSLLKDLSDISDFAPPVSIEHPRSFQKAPPVSEKALLNSILSRTRNFQSHLINQPPVPDPTPYNTLKNYTPPERLKPYLQTLRLLLVEDNRVNQKLMCKISERVGVMVEFIRQAFDGIEALEALEDMERIGQFPDIIMLDCSMPRMDGFSFLEAFGKRWPAARVPVIGLTAHFFRQVDV
ncbi:hypothetical protein ABW20_dc0106882 [Dactylellina cionopaga]|nr:hypothetical protein ABW20_dc0106882 [Dactylellina cionopaga]